MSDGYERVFDISAHPLALGSWMVLPLILPAIGIAAILLPEDILPSRSKLIDGKTTGWIMLLFSVAISSLLLFEYVQKDMNLNAAEKAGNADIAEGCLDYFHARDREGREKERLQLGGRVFEYSDDDMTPAFHFTALKGGPMEADSRVRLAYVGDDIVRLELKAHACPAAPDFSTPG